MNAPVALFVYRRPEHTRRTLESLLACKEVESTPLHIYCDGPKTSEAVDLVAETRRVARKLAPVSTVFVERANSWGLARSIIQGVTELTDRFGRVIVLEDDLELAPSFLRFMNLGLDRYADDEAVFHVSGYQFALDPPLHESALLLPFPNSWGWGTWARAWRHFDPDANGYARLQRDKDLRQRFDLDGGYPYFKMLEAQRRGQVDSWALRWYLSMFDKNRYALFPGKSLVRNTGFDGTGTHGAEPTYRDQPLDSRTAEDWEMPTTATINVAAFARVRRFLIDERKATRRTSIRSTARRWAKTVLSDNQVARLQEVADKLLGDVIGRSAPDSQDLDVYWDPKMAALLETWGIGNAWNEIQLLLANLRGKVVDIACGTGKVMTLLEPYPALEIHGFDISDFLIQKAIDRGIPRERLTIADATKTEYPDQTFDYGYSIGSLEHFTEAGILQFMAETHRITRLASFHQIPVSRSGRDEGWIKTLQSYHNNSVDWWLERFRSAYDTVHVLDSAWNDKISVGKWFVCVSDRR